MSIKQYKAFVFAVDEGSLSKAGQKLNCTQSAITHLINSFEEECGFSLMTRTKSGICLTEKGERLYPIIKNIIEKEERLFEIISFFKGKNNNVVRIGTFTSVAVNWLPGIIRDFTEKYPQAEFSIVDGGYGDINDNLESGNIDMGFVAIPSPIEGKIIELYDDEMLAIIPKGHSYANAERFPIKLFETENVISLNHGTDQDSRQVFEKNRIKPNIKYTTSDDYAMIAMVENNLGICMEPRLLLKGRENNVKVMKLQPPSFRKIGLVVPYTKFSNPLALKVAEFIELWVKENVIKNN